MEAYEGNEPYIFISYARKDSDKATPFLKALSGAGYRVWWDTGIKAGEYWTKTLAEKINGCAVFCPLYSEAFNVSRFCFDETNYAYRKNKAIVPVYLEKIAQENLDEFYQFLGGRQDLRLYEYANAAEFAERLGREQAFTLCKAPEWNKTGQIQWRFSDADGVLTIAKNEDMPNYYRRGSIPHYQYDPTHECSTAPWAPYRGNILSVEIADNIRVIGDFTFWACERLTAVSIGDGATVIGDFAFYRCYGLKDVLIGDGVTRIGDFSFHDCQSLTSVRIPNGVTKIGGDAFSSCRNLTDVHIGDGVTKIGDYAFWNCSRLTDVRIPDSVTKIGGCAFLGCESLKSVEIPARTEVGIGAFPSYIRVIRRAAPGQ